MNTTQTLNGPAVSPDGCYKLSQFEAQVCQELAQRATALKNGAAPQTKPGKALGLLFLNPSLRTSASFQRAAARLQLELVNLNGQGVWAMESQEGAVMDGNKAEHMKDAAAVLGRFVDVLAIRAFPAGEDLESDLTDPVLRGFAKHAGVPIINMESTLWHPCQALADWATLDQHQVPKPAKFVLTWAWHPIPLPHAVANSTVCMAAQRGMEVVLLHPRGYHLHPEILAEADALAESNGGTVRISHDREEALEGAQVIYAKSWGSLDTWGDSAAETAQRANLRDWCVTSKYMPQGAKFMHCLPVRRNVVVSDEVIDGPGSIVIDQAENRLHAQTALLEKLLS
ncbi:MAG: N-acetylornithine carbamoyltransferase [Planctomycetes bacterium]|nr:N-acetylornithine carbamoyltransferase [Planctomycetota bacterium]